MVPHDLPYYRSINETKAMLCDDTVHCFGRYFKGVILHQGQVVIPTIGGLYRPPLDPIKGSNTKNNVKIQPHKSTTYLDFQDKKIKWGPELPKGRYHHCVVKYNESTAFVFGGGEVAGKDGKGYLIKYYMRGVAIVKELRSGFFMHYPDPKQPDNYKITYVSGLKL